MVLNKKQNPLCFKRFSVQLPLVYNRKINDCHGVDDLFVNGLILALFHFLHHLHQNIVAYVEESYAIWKFYFMIYMSFLVDMEMITTNQKLGFNFCD